MKTIITLIAASLFSFNAIAGNPEYHPEKYCAKMKDGKKMVMHKGSAITVEVTLQNGTRIQPDGTIIKTDGSRVTLNEGECINKDGDIAREKEKKNKPK